MFLVCISNPLNEKECEYYTIVDNHLKGDLLRNALWAVGRKYEINFYPTDIYIGMKDIAVAAPKVTVGELLCIYSKIKFYKEVQSKVEFAETVDMVKTVSYHKEHINVDISSVPKRCFLRLSSRNAFTSVREDFFVEYINDRLDVSFMMGSTCYHYPLDSDETITVDKEAGIIIRKYKEVKISYKTVTRKELI